MKTNLVIDFYKKLTLYLIQENIRPGEATELLKLASEAGVSPDFSSDKLRWLDEMKNHLSKGRGIDNQFMYYFWSQVFRDLTAIKNPDAMEVFHKFCDCMLGSLNLKVHVVWSEKIKIRKDGSVISRVHMSQSDSLHRLIDRSGITIPKGSPEEGVVFLA